MCECTVSVSELSESSVYFSTGSMSGKWETERARECSDGVGQGNLSRSSDSVNKPR